MRVLCLSAEADETGQIKAALLPYDAAGGLLAG
jgi:hypothetical protein